MSELLQFLVGRKVGPYEAPFSLTDPHNETGLTNLDWLPAAVQSS